jgi:hypothetical protein
MPKLKHFAVVAALAAVQGVAAAAEPVRREGTALRHREWDRRLVRRHPRGARPGGRGSAADHADDDDGAGGPALRHRAA